MLVIFLSIFLEEIQCRCQYEISGTTLVRLTSGADQCEIESSIAHIESNAFQDQGHTIQYLSFASGSQLVSVSEYGLAYLSGCTQLDMSECHLLNSLASNSFTEGSFTSILLPNPCKVTSLPPGTFGECKNLNEIIIPPSVRIFENWNQANQFVFRGCSSLKHVYFTDDSELFTLGNHCLGGTALVSFKIPAKCEQIFANPFYFVITLTSIDVDSRNPKFKSADGIVFQKNSQILQIFPPGREVDYTIPDGYTLADASFKGTKVTGITFSDAMTEVPWHGLAHCYYLKFVLKTQNIIAFREQAFEGDSQIQEMEISPLATIFATAAFSGLQCNSLIIKNYLPAMQGAGITKEMFHKCPSDPFSVKRKTIEPPEYFIKIAFHTVYLRPIKL